MRVIHPEDARQYALAAEKRVLRYGTRKHIANSQVILFEEQQLLPQVIEVSNSVKELNLRLQLATE